MVDQAMMAAIADEPVPGGGPGEADADARFGFATPDDKAFLYRSLASLCGAGIPLGQAVTRIVSTLERPVGEADEAAKASHFAGRLAAALGELGDDKPGRRPMPPGHDMLHGLLERSGVLLHDVERCMFSFRLAEVDGTGLAAAFDRGLSCVLAMQARVAESARARAAR